MKQAGIKHFDELIDIARENGATAAKIIPTKMVVIDERVRLKCEVPRCTGYGHYLTCPPYVMPVDIFGRILSRYKWCFLVQVEEKNINSMDKSKGRIDHTGLNPMGWTECVRVADRILSPERGQKGSCHENPKKVPSRVQTPNR